MEEKNETNSAIEEVIKALKEAKPIKGERKTLKENVKAIFYFIIKALFFLSILGFLFLILSDRRYGGGPVIFVFSIWGLIEYAKWVIKTFNPKE
jgi:cation transport ATPase